MRHCSSCPLRKSSSDIVVDELWSLCEAAYTQYKNEVIGFGKLYDRYADDFLNSHSFSGNLDAASMNEHRKNFGIMTELLRKRKDLVEKYFRNGNFGFEAFQALHKELDTTVAPTVMGHGQEKTLLPKPDRPKPSFQCFFNKIQLSLIANYANEAQLFSTPVTPEDMERFFASASTEPLKAANNRRVVVFLDAMCDMNLICRRWQHVIAENLLLVSSVTDRPLKVSNLSSALNEAKAEPRCIYDTIRKMVEQIARSIESGSKESI